MRKESKLLNLLILFAAVTCIIAFVLSKNYVMLLMIVPLILFYFLLRRR